MRNRRYLPALMCAAALLGCDAASPRGTIAGPELRPLLNASGAEEFVTTGGAFMTGPQSGLFFQRTSFEARRQPDGSVVGQYEATVSELGGQNPFAHIHAVVTCFTIVGNVARLGGIVTHVSGRPLFLEGEPIIWTVQDNGEGNNDPPDIASGANGGDPELHCSTGFYTLMMNDVLEGNVQIHGAAP